MSRRNPSAALSGTALAALAVGAYFLFFRKSAPVDGLGFSIGKKLKKVVKKVAKPVALYAVNPIAPIIKPAIRVAKSVVKVAAKPAMLAIAPATFVAAKAGKMIVAKVNPRPKGGTRTLAPIAAAGEQVQYQDQNGNAITKQQYDVIQAEYDRQAALAQTMNAQPVRTQQWGEPSGAQSSVDYSNQSYAQQFAPSGGGGGGGGAEPSSSDYYSPPQQSAAAEQNVMPTAADAAIDAPKKINPLVTIGAFAAIPVIFGLVGEK